METERELPPAASQDEIGDEELLRRFGRAPQWIQGIFVLGCTVGGIRTLVAAVDVLNPGEYGPYKGGSHPSILLALVSVVGAAALLAAALGVYRGVRHAARLTVLAMLVVIGADLIALPLLIPSGPLSVQPSWFVRFFWPVVWLMYFLRSKAVRAQYGPCSLKDALNLVLGR